MQTIHWYPGHMAKAKRQLAELIKYIDLILEIRDARLPLSSHNQDLESIFNKRPTIILLNKVDLADPNTTTKWGDFFQKQGFPVVQMNGKNGQGLNELWRQLGKLFPQAERKRSIRIGVIGIPNVGKSSLLNRLLGTGAAKTGNLPGVTRGKQWIKRNGFEILDTPGILPPKINDQEIGVKLALVGTIREEIIPAYDLALLLMERYGEELFDWGKANLSLGNPEEQLIWYTKSRGFLIKGGEPDINRGASTLLREFRNGLLGKISLEFPPADEKGD